jgi:hypothetical protein
VHRDLAESVGQAIELTNRVGAEQLKIPVNKPFGGLLALVRDDAKPVRLGRLSFTVIGPFKEDLDALRKEWNKWLNEEKQQHEALMRRMRRDAERLPTNELELLHEPLRLAAEELGNRGRVTVPNLASLMFFVEGGGRTIILTGDGHANDILKGLEHAGRIKPNGALHVDVLKVQHHGSEHNMTRDFARRITADRYVFCANGEHQNPDPRVVKAIIESRLGPAERRSTNPDAAGPFEFVFSTASGRGSSAPERLLRKTESDVAAAARASGGRLRFTFSSTPSFELDLR